MKKPQAPEDREGHEIRTVPHRNDFLIADTFRNQIWLGEITDAEMLIFALQEWIEYKRQLELCERECVL